MEQAEILEKVALQIDRAMEILIDNNSTELIINGNAKTVYSKLQEFQEELTKAVCE
jgi:hypothetical protein